MKACLFGRQLFLTEDVVRSPFSNHLGGCIKIAAHNIRHH